MGNTNLINVFFGGLFGGFVVALVNWLREYLIKKKERKISNLQSKIQNLYGPLQYFASQNESYLELNKKFQEAYQVEYEERKWSQRERTQEILKQEATKTLEIGNTYIKMVTKNNENILEILRNNYSYIDADDVEIFRQLTVDYTRLKTEINESGALETPFLIYKHIGSIAFMRPDFIERVKDKFHSKKAELDSLIS